MTKEEKKECERILGKNYSYLDTPTFIRNREKKERKMIIDYQKKDLNDLMEKLMPSRKYHWNPNLEDFNN